MRKYDEQRRYLAATLIKHGCSLTLAREVTYCKDRSKNYAYVGNGNKAKRRMGWRWQEYRCPHNIGDGDCACEDRGDYREQFVNEGY